MSSNNGSNIVKIGRKGKKKFLFGDDDSNVFEVDIVTAFQEFCIIDDNFRPPEDDGGNRVIPEADIPAYHDAIVAFVKDLARGNADDITKAEALDFLARLREQYDELADFFRPKSRRKQDSPSSTEARSEVRFSEEAAH